MAEGFTNPLLVPWTGPHTLPPFDRLRVEHYEPAFDAALADADREIKAIATRAEAPTFDNTIAALETSGQTLGRVSAVFWSIAGTDTTPEIQALERALAPRLTSHWMKVYQDARLFARVDALDRAKDTLGLSLEQRQVLAKYVRAFVKAGARLDPAGQATLKANAERASTLSTQFSQNVLADEQGWSMILDEADLAGLDESQRASAAAAAKRLGHDGRYAITLSRSSVVPFLEYAERRDLREKAYKAFVARGANGGASDNRGVLAELVRIRAVNAKLLGFKSFAENGLEATMAKTPAAVLKLLDAVWQPARRAALGERDLLQAHARAGGANFEIAAWDWRFYAEKVRKAKYDLDEAEIKPYLQLDRMIAAMFDCASRLFGLTFQEIKGVTLHNPEARLWSVARLDGTPVGHFIGDFYMRPSKRSGAWMSAYRGAHKLAASADGRQLPIITNTCNFVKPAQGEPALLSLEDARTLFHEFGHALHGLLSNVTYPSIAGTAVPRDFVELPSQLYEHWLTTPHVLKGYATHYKTGQPMPDDLIARMKAARSFNQGFLTCEYLGSAIFDMDLHQRGADAGVVDVDAAEAQCLARIGMPAEIGMRHRPAHFQHITGGYAAGYYSYLWSEVMDADAFDAFEDTGDVFDAATAKKLHDHIYSAGSSREPDDLYKAFRGRLPDTGPLLEKRGLSASGARS